jgi:hypothetical protein
MRSGYFLAETRFEIELYWSVFSSAIRARIDFEIRKCRLERSFLAFESP